MSLSLSQTLTAVAVNVTSSFQAQGGTGPYTYSVRANGAGGSINSSGIYTAPQVMGATPQTLYDTVVVTDNVGAVATAQILVGSPLFLLCDILQTYLGLAPGRVYLWDQKIIAPTDSGLYIAVSMMSCKPFANNSSYDTNGDLIQYVNMLATIDIDIISRGPAARDQKEQVLMAIMSDYSQLQQSGNSFAIGRLPAGSKFINLSMVDGAAIPYRYKISFNMQYAVASTIATNIFTGFNSPTVITNP
jgi:hypothetical protein